MNRTEQIGLRSGDCGGHLSKVNSLFMFKKPVWDDLSFVTWWIILLEVDYTVVIKGWTWSETILRYAVAFKRCSIGMKCAKKNSPRPLHHHHQPDPLRQGRIDPCFHVLYAKFWPYHLNVAAEIETHQTRQRFSNLLFFQFWEACANCILRFLFLADRSGTRCGLLLLEPICFRVRRVVRSEMVFCIPWL